MMLASFSPAWSRGAVRPPFIEGMVYGVMVVVCGGGLGGQSAPPSLKADYPVGW